MRASFWANKACGGGAARRKGEVLEWWGSVAEGGGVGELG